MPVAGEVANDDCFSWVMAHAWSRFRPAAPGAPLDAEEKDVPQDRETPGTKRGYEPVMWAAERLGPAVKAVTIQELLWRVRLRLRPRATLTRWLEEMVAAKGKRMPSEELAASIAEARAVLAKSDTDVTASRRCFELLKRIHEAA